MRQIIGSYTEEIHMLCQLITDHNGSRSLYHNPLLRISIFNILHIKLCANLRYNFLNPLYFPYTGYHWIHNRNFPIGTCPKQCPKLRFKYIFSCQADSDCTNSHSWIFLMSQLKIIALLICSNIQSTDNHTFSRHCFGHCSVNLKLLLFCWKILFFQINKLTPKQSDTTCIIFDNHCQIFYISNIGIQHNPFSIKSNVFLSLELF